MYLSASLLSASLQLLLIPSSFGQPVFRHKSLHLLHHHHSHPHRRVGAGLDVSDYEIQKNIRPVLSSELPSHPEAIPEGDPPTPNGVVPQFLNPLSSK